MELAIFAVEQVADGISASGIHLACTLAFLGARWALAARRSFIAAAIGAAVRETRLFGTQFKLFTTDDAGLDGKLHIFYYFFLRFFLISG